VVEGVAVGCWATWVAGTKAVTVAGRGVPASRQADRRTKKEKERKMKRRRREAGITRILE
jgi:hypothetical protein